MFWFGFGRGWKFSPDVGREIYMYVYMYVYMYIYIRVFIAELYSREWLKISTKFLLQVVIHPFACVVKYVRKFWEVRVT